MHGKANSGEGYFVFHSKTNLGVGYLVFHCKTNPSVGYLVSPGKANPGVGYLVFQIKANPLVFGLDLKCLVLWQLLLLTCAAPTHAQKYLGKNTFIYLFVSPIDAGSQKCTQGTPSVKGRKKYYLKWVN